MVHIGKTKKGKFIVANIAKNGEILKVSETLNSKAAAWKNIKAERLSCYNGVAFVQDDTSETSKVYAQGYNRIISDHIKPEKKYQPK